MSESVRFQHYEVFRREDGSLFELGRGAMGITYKAFDTNLRCNVALKVINSTYLNSEIARQRFLREARAAAAIRHPNVATVFHLGNEDDAFFYAMEFIDGETVEDIMKRDGAVPTLMALEIVAQVARALGAAQKQGLVHRDIKPSNLMLVHEDSDEFTVKVIDFGLAKAADKESGIDTSTITVGGFLGTPHFASPEQLEELELDVRSDIYALGVTLYYMLAGKTPFSGSLAQVMSQHLHREPPVSLLSDQPPNVVELLEKMMAKDPKDRQQTPSELRKEVEACIESVEESRTGTGGGAVPIGDDKELMETVVEIEPSKTSALEPAPGVRLADRFELLDQYKPGEYGKTFRARNLETNEIVAILILNPDLLPTSEAYTRLEDEVTALQAVRHPSVIRIESLERAHHLSWVAREWVEGPSLLETMRSRGTLPIAESMAILTSLAGGLEAVQKTGVPCPELSAHWITLATNSEPPGQPKFNALNFAKVAPASPDATLVTSPAARARASGAFRENARGEFAFALAAIAYEMLGGVRSGSSHETFVPIAGLSEEANLVLRQAFAPATGFASPVDFVAKLSEAMGDSASSHGVQTPPPPAPPRSGSIPPPLPPPKRKPPVALIAGLVLLAVVAAAGVAAWLVIPRIIALASSTRSDATPEPTPTPAIAVTTPTPPPTPEPTPFDPRQLAIQQAQDLAAAQNYAPALNTLVALTPNYPGETVISDEMEKIAAKLRSERDTLSAAELVQLEGPLEQAALAHSTSAQMLLAESYKESDPDKAFKYYLLAADGGNSEANFQVAEMYAKDRNFEKAFDHYKRAADDGEKRAMYAVGELLHKGKGVEADQKRAIYYLSNAAGYGDPYAMNLLGDMYRKGIGLDKPNLHEAHRLFAAATEKGFYDAQGNLGVMIIEGETEDETLFGGGVKTTEERAQFASELFKRGADGKNGLCTYYWAMCLEGGIGIAKKSPGEARKMYVKAAELGNGEAQKVCKERSLNFTPPGSVESE